MSPRHFRAWMIAAAMLGDPVASYSQQSSRQAPKAAQPQTAVRPPSEGPAWATGSILTDIPGNLVVVGTADGSSESQAQRNSLESASYRAATELVRRFEAEGRPLALKFDTFRSYLRRIGRVDGVHTVPYGSGYRAYSRMYVNNGLLDPVTIRNLAGPSAKSADRVAVGYLVVPSDAKGSEKIGTLLTTYRVAVRSVDPSDGNFIVGFTVVRTRAAGVRIRVQQIDVIDDGSSGGTTWSFQIVVNGRPAIKLAAASYDDKVGRYPLRDGDPQLEFNLTGTDPNIEVQVLAIRPGNPP